MQMQLETLGKRTASQVQRASHDIFKLNLMRTHHSLDAHDAVSVLRLVNAALQLLDHTSQRLIAVMG